MNEMRKLMEAVAALSEGQNFSEARRLDDPDVSYDLQGDTKSKTLSQEFTKITATITGPTSAHFTRLAKKFKQIDDMNKEIKALRDSANKEAKQHIEELFDAQDATLTRYIDTVSLSITMAKDTKDREDVDVDFAVEEFFGELYKLVDQSLIPAIEQLKEKHTMIEKKIIAGRKGALKVTTKESITQSLLSKIQQFASTLGEVTSIKMSEYDQRLNQLRSQYQAATA